MTPLIQIQRKLERRIVVNVCNGSDSKSRAWDNARRRYDCDKADFHCVASSGATKNAETTAARIFDLSNIGEEILLGVSHVEEYAILGRHSHSGMLQIFLDHNRKSNRSKLQVSRGRPSSAGNAFRYRTNTAISARDTQLGTPKHKLKIKSSSICARASLPVPPTCPAISGRVKFSTGAPVRRGGLSPLMSTHESGPAVTLGSSRAETHSFTASSLPDANWRQARYSKLAEPDAPSHTAQWECAA